jgi:hypothetical protein
MATAVVIGVMIVVVIVVVIGIGEAENRRGHVADGFFTYMTMICTMPW